MKLGYYPTVNGNDILHALVSDHRALCGRLLDEKVERTTGTVCQRCREIAEAKGVRLPEAFVVGVGYWRDGPNLKKVWEALTADLKRLFRRSHG